MADISDVEQAIVNLAASVLYPNGPAQPSALPGHAPVVVHRGWPLSTDLDRDLPAGKSHVSVWPKGGTERNVTKYPEDYQELSRDTPSLTVSVQSNKITIGGTVNTAVPQFVTIQIGPRFVASYVPVAGDTPASIAFNISQLITAQFALAIASGATINVQTGSPIRSIVGVTGVQISELKRQVTQLQITIWAPSPDIRDAIAKLLDPAFADNKFLTLADGSAGFFRYDVTLLSDMVDREHLYRRDIIYTVEYGTTKTDGAFEVTSVGIGVDANDGSFGIAPPVNVTAPEPQNPPAIRPSGLDVKFKPATPN